MAAGQGLETRGRRGKGWRENHAIFKIPFRTFFLTLNNLCVGICAGGSGPGEGSGGGGGAGAGRKGANAESRSGGEREQARQCVERGRGSLGGPRARDLARGGPACRGYLSSSVPPRGGDAFDELAPVQFINPPVAVGRGARARYYAISLVSGPLRCPPIIPGEFIVIW